MRWPLVVVMALAGCGSSTPPPAQYVFEVETGYSINEISRGLAVAGTPDDATQAAQDDGCGVASEWLTPDECARLAQTLRDIPRDAAAARALGAQLRALDDMAETLNNIEALQERQFRAQQFGIWVNAFRPAPAAPVPPVPVPRTLTCWHWSELWSTCN